MSDAEMDLINGMFRAELEKFKQADEATKINVIKVIDDAGALDWLLEISRADKDANIRAYATLAEKYKNGKNGTSKQ